MKTAVMFKFRKFSEIFPVLKYYWPGNVRFRSNFCHQGKISVNFFFFGVFNFIGYKTNKYFCWIQIKYKTSSYSFNKGTWLGFCLNWTDIRCFMTSWTSYEYFIYIKSWSRLYWISSSSFLTHPMYPIPTINISKLLELSNHSI